MPVRPLSLWGALSAKSPEELHVLSQRLRFFHSRKVPCPCTCMAPPILHRPVPPGAPPRPSEPLSSLECPSGSEPSHPVQRYEYLRRFRCPPAVAPGAHFSTIQAASPAGESLSPQRLRFRSVHTHLLPLLISFASTPSRPCPPRIVDVNSTLSEWLNPRMISMLPSLLPVPHSFRSRSDSSALQTRRPCH